MHPPLCCNTLMHWLMHELKWRHRRYRRTPCKDYSSDHGTIKLRCDIRCAYFKQVFIHLFHHFSFFLACCHSHSRHSFASYLCVCVRSVEYPRHNTAARVCIRIHSFESFTITQHRAFVDLFQREYIRS